MGIFNVNSKDLQNAFDKNLKVINKKATLPILAYSLCEVITENDKSKLKIRSTNLETEIISYIDITLPDISNIPFLVNISDMINVIKKTSDQPLTFSYSDNMNTIKTDKGKYGFGTFNNIDEFPVEMDSKRKDESILTLNSDLFISIINKIKPFLAKDELRPVMNGISFRYDKTYKTLFAAGTDAHKLLLVDTKNNTEIDFILPDTLAILKSIILEEDVTMFIGENYVKILGMYDEIFIRLIEGTYPNYMSIIPLKENYNYCISFNIAEIKNVIERIKSLSVSTVIFKVLSDNTIKIVGANIDENLSGEEEFNVIEIERYNDFNDDIEFAFNPDKFLDLLSGFSCSELNLYGIESQKAFTFKNANADDRDSIGILMPVMITSKV